MIETHGHEKIIQMQIWGLFGLYLNISIHGQLIGTIQLLLYHLQPQELKKNNFKKKLLNYQKSLFGIKLKYLQLKAWQGSVIRFLKAFYVIK